jgi:hypothetical protein
MSFAGLASHKCLTASFKIKTDGKNASCIEGERQTTRSAVGEPRGLANEHQAVKRSYVTSRGASCKVEDPVQSRKTLWPVRLGKAVARQQIANSATAPSTIHREAFSTAIDESKIRAPTSVQTKDNRFIECQGSFNYLEVSRHTVETGCKLIGVNRPDEKKHEHGLAEGIQLHLVESIKLSGLRRAREKSITDMITTLSVLIYLIEKTRYANGSSLRTPQCWKQLKRFPS